MKHHPAPSLVPRQGASKQRLIRIVREAVMEILGLDSLQSGTIPCAKLRDIAEEEI